MLKLWTVIANPYILLAIGLTLGGSYLYGYFNGRSSVIQAQMVDTLRSAKDATETRSNVARLPSTAVTRQLRDKWQR